MKINVNSKHMDRSGKSYERTDDRYLNRIEDRIEKT
jgi:hypothetical protein